MTAVSGGKLLGEPVDRVDGLLKVTGAAPYPSDFSYPDMAHAALVQSTVAAGTIASIDTGEALVAPGVLTVITHENAPRLAEAPMSLLGPAPRFPLKDDRVLHHGQHVAVVVAETPEQARDATRLVRVEYDEAAPVLGVRNLDAPVLTDPYGMESGRGDVEAALAAAEVQYDETFIMAPETNNPLGLFGTVARWEDGRLTVHDCSQWPVNARQNLAAVFEVPEESVRVLVPYLGGGFGAGLRTWGHTILAALAARMLRRPVKLVLTRPQMFTSVGHRPESVQRLRIGATADGRLVAVDHEGTATRGVEEMSPEPITLATPDAYACPNVSTHDRLVALNIPSPGAMRAPGHAEGGFALESALDELSYRVGVDPVELRLRNYAAVHPPTGLPWSSNALRDCYRVGAERFGWSARPPEPRSQRDGAWLVGQGMAGVTFTRWATLCRARMSVDRDGTALVRSASTDIGTGTYTITAQLVADLLGLDVEQVRVELGDSDLPLAPQSGGSGLALALSGAVEDAARNLLRTFLTTVRDDTDSPLAGRSLDEIAVAGGRIHLASDPSAGETYTAILARHGLDELVADGERDPSPPEGLDMAPAGAFAAQFAEVRVHEELGTVRVSRMSAAVDAGRVLNEKTARSQVAGAMVMGIGMALLEETAFDSVSGRITNATLGDYLIPVHADVPDLDVTFVGGPDRFNAVGVKGIGEVGIAGAPAAIANAVYHATGRRIRSLPITLDRLL
ncbi:xanthine dehydrogenase family protein molybdopterin-binding subunit [Streptomyces sp. TS71-3]|uniref:xanthine dehydrogenase family protein molybdopterin-binding subunit n=1 Tax=Streptomyces sp. TS71-3 TaxID=2733862 RepID=UPI001B175908|nr:xanthine dehydrogenase family protein molybdopterin-binding subunit [Streptomyces sp. TS71-3]GHJ38009.1 acylaldehyde oxidase [Streptomyces sp. TS71-3]